MQHAAWVNPEHHRRPIEEHPSELSFIILARKTQHEHTGPKLHPALVPLIPLAQAQQQEGTPMLPIMHESLRCGALTLAVKEDSDALLLGKAPKVLLGDVLRHIAGATHDEPM